MNIIAIRRLLITIHLYAAGFLAPLFLLVGFTGAAYIAGVEPKAVETPIDLPATLQIDPTSPSLDDDVSTILVGAGIDPGFDYLQTWDGGIQTRPTSRTYVEFDLSGDAPKATKFQPDFYYSLLEMHKGHGPEIFRIYQIIAGTGLLIVVIGGVAVGLIAPAYRRDTLIASALGLVAFVGLGFLA